MDLTPGLYATAKKYVPWPGLKMSGCVDKGKAGAELPRCRIFDF
jgi:hypothetical protein